MKTVAIIAEYNPFHNGHRYQMDKIKELTGCDCLIIIMSGDFVQRGAPAIIDKYTRTEMALAAGADLVFELPVCYSTASAELFAYGAIKLLDQLQVVDYLCFGSECGNIDLLDSIADVLVKEPVQIKDVLRDKLKEGLSYPLARNHALSLYFNQDSKIDSLLDQPNNILGIEYLKALKKLNSKIQPLTIERTGSGYHEQNLNHSFCSATALRKHFEENSKENISFDIEHYVPSDEIKLLEDSYRKTFPITSNDFSTLLYYRLQNETKDSLLRYQDVTSELAARIMNECIAPFSFLDFAMRLKTRQYTYTRVTRALLHILLGITTEKMTIFMKETDSSYLRVLGFRKAASKMLRSIQNTKSIPLITKVADAKLFLTESAMDCFSYDIAASHLYHQIIYHKFGTLLKSEYQISPIRKDFGIEKA